jgi:hypothetical protein
VADALPAVVKDDKDSRIDEVKGGSGSSDGKQQIAEVEKVQDPIQLKED